jgi:HEAT repeat protein
VILIVFGFVSCGCADDSVAEKARRSTQAGHGTVSSSSVGGELARVSAICFQLQEYEHLTDGKHPASWEEFFSVVHTAGLTKEFMTTGSDLYRFVDDGPSLVYDTRQPDDVGQVIAVGVAPIRDLEKPTLGRYVILRMPRGTLPGAVRVHGPDRDVFIGRWVPEHQLRELLDRAARRAEGDQKKHVEVSVQVMNPAAKLLPGEPVCLFVKAVTTPRTMPDHPRFVVEVAGPGGTRSIPLSAFNGVESSHDSGLRVLFEDGDNNTLVASIQVAFGSPFVADFDDRLSVPTAEPGSFSVRLSERESGCESPAVQFEVVAATGRDSKAAALFKTRSGHLDGDLPQYEKLLKNYPDSRLAKYAALVVARAEWTKLVESNDFPNYRTRAAEVAKLADKTLELGFASIFDLQAMLLKARCLGVQGHYEAQRALLATIIDRYAGVSGVEHLFVVQEIVGRQHPNLIDRLADPDPKVRIAAAKALSAQDHRWFAGPAMFTLIDLTCDLDFEVAGEAHMAAGKITFGLARPAAELLADLQKPDRQIRRHAAWELGRVYPAPSEAIGPLIRTLQNDEDKVVRALAASSSYSAVGPNARRAVSALLGAFESDPELVVRRKAGGALSATLGRADESAVPVLVRVMDDPDAPVRFMAITLLGQLGPGAKSAIPALTKALADDDKKLQQAAAGALAAIGPDSAPALPLLLDRLQQATETADRSVWAAAVAKIDPNRQDLAVLALVPFLSDPQPTARLNAAIRLSRLGPDLAVPHLAAVLKHQDPAVRRDAARQLGLIGPDAKPAASSLAALLGDADAEARLSATIALLQIDPDHAEAGESLAELLQSQDLLLRGHVVAGLAELKLPGKAVVPVLIAALQGNDYFQAMAAARALRQMGPASGALPALVKRMSAPQPRDVQIRTAGAVAKFDPANQAAFDILIAALDDAAGSSRMEAAESLGELGGAAEPAVPALAKQLSDDYEQARRVAADALGKIGPQAKGVVAALVRGLDSADPAVRLRVVQGLAKCGPAARDAVPNLIETLHDGNSQVVLEAVRSLGEIGPTARPARTKLLALLANGHSVMRLAVAVALVKMDVADSEIVPVLVESLQPTFGNPLRADSLQALALLGPKAKQARPIVTELLNDQDPAIRSLAKSVLDRLGE